MFHFYSRLPCESYLNVTLTGYLEDPALVVMVTVLQSLAGTGFAVRLAVGCRTDAKH